MPTDVRDSTSVTSTLSHNINNYTYISRNAIHKRKLTLEFAARSLTTDDHVTPEEKLDELNLMKENCRDMMKSEIEAYMLDEIQAQGLTYRGTSVKSSEIYRVKTMS